MIQSPRDLQQQVPGAFSLVPVSGLLAPIQN